MTEKHSGRWWQSMPISGVTLRNSCDSLTYWSSY